MIEPYLTHEMLERLVRLPKPQRRMALDKIGQEEWARCAEDIFYWIDPKRHPIPYVYTKDPHAMFTCNLCAHDEDPTLRVTWDTFHRKVHLLSTHKIEARTDRECKPHFTELDTIRVFPMHDYFTPIIEAWLEDPMMAVEKSRDMMATWLIVTCYTWDSLFHKGRQNIFQSENAQKTRDLVDRAYTLWLNQPAWLRNVQKAIDSEGTNRAGKLTVPGMQSEIIGFPQGADKIRQYHPSGVFSDEAAFNPYASECFAAIKPAIANGGRYTAISSANPGWFMHVCKDSLDQIS